MTDHIDATQEDREALEPCPFCGGDAYLANPEPNALWRVICANNCGAGNYVSNRTAAIAVWNHRLASTAALQERCDALAARVEALEGAGEAMRLINELRGYEGDSVTILCDNPGDFDSSYEAAIDCNGDWTDWQDRRFEGQTILECLIAADAARDALGEG